MTREIVFVIIVGVAVLALAAMWWGWRRRTVRDRDIVAPTEVPATALATQDFEGFYVATTVHGDPLNRLAIRHLAFRGRVAARVRADGIVLEIPGEPTVFLAAASLRAAVPATWTIDRVVERGGLVAVSWAVPAPTTDASDDTAPHDTVVDTYLRLHERSVEDFILAVRPLIRAHTTTGSES